MPFIRRFALVAIVTVAPALAFAANVKPFRFVHMSDTHFGAGNNAVIDTAMFKEISALDPLPAFCVNTGDICEIGGDEEYAMFQEALKELKPKMYIAPGNHDVRWNPRGKEGYTRGTKGPLFQSWDYNGVHFVTLDATVLLQHWGHISQEQLDWLKKDLDKTGEETPVIIGFHHWIGREKVMVDNEQALIDLTAPYNIVLWLQGHGHADIEWNINGAPAIMEGGLYQGSYSVIDVDQDQLHIKRRRIPKKADQELLQKDTEPRIGTGQWTDLMTVPLTKQARPKWNASAQLDNQKVNVTAQRGDLPDNAKLEVRVDGGDYQAMNTKGDEWTVQLPADKLIAGEHLLTVQATLSNGRAFQKPVTLKVPGIIAPVWEHNVGGAVQSHLVRDGDTLYVTTMGGDLVAMNPQNGDEKWRGRTHDAVFSTPHVQDGVVYFGSADHYVYATDAKTGDLKWKAETGGAVLGSAAKTNGIVCIGSVDTKIYGLTEDKGKVAWYVKGENMYQTKAATDGDNFFVGGWDNNFRCIESKTGVVRWALRLGKSQRGWFFSAFSPAITSPTVGEGKLPDGKKYKYVYISTNDGVLHAIDIELGKEMWRIDWKNMGYSSPLFHDGKIYCALSDKGRVFRADAGTGHIDWEADTGSVIYDSSFCFGGGNVFIGCVDGTFSAIDANTGKIQWQYRLGPGHVLDSPAADEKQVYISSMSGKVTALPVKANETATAAK
jgi:outer membrane protein assembly factor BamB